MASTQLKLSPNRTMQIAQKLYMNGDITYPRTESTRYTSDNEIKRNLKKLASFNEDDSSYDEENELFFLEDDYYEKQKQDIVYEEEDEYCYADDAQQILDEFVSAPPGGEDVGDHPPITPARLRQKKDFRKQED